MTDDTTVVRHWSDWQNDLLVADYFDMFRRIRAGEKVNRLERNRQLQKLTGRTKGSIERKRMNVSAVLDDLHMHWMRGFAPDDHFQGSLVDAVQRYLDRHPEWFDDADRAANVSGATTLIEGPPPPASGKQLPVKPLMERIARRYNHAERDYQNRRLGYLGEERVYFRERERLEAAGCAKLAREVEWTSKEKGDGVGYDILSFNTDGSKRLIEVKTTTGPRTTPFFLTRTELAVAEEEAGAWHLYRLHDMADTPGLFQLRPPLEASVILNPETWRASF